MSGRRDFQCQSRYSVQYYYEYFMVIEMIDILKCFIYHTVAFRLIIQNPMSPMPCRSIYLKNDIQRTL